jgi:predicted MFS family arabinose efflux permease
VTCAFTIAVLVLPELLALNNISRWVMCLFLYPMFNFSVDAKAMGSAFAPNVLYTLSSLREGHDDLFFSGPLVARFVGSICGGVIGGKVMKRYFPDDPKEL